MKEDLTQAFVVPGVDFFKFNEVKAKLYLGGKEGYFPMLDPLTKTLKADNKTAPAVAKFFADWEKYKVPEGDAIQRLWPVDPEKEEGPNDIQNKNIVGGLVLVDGHHVVFVY